MPRDLLNSLIGSSLLFTKLKNRKKEQGFRGIGMHCRHSRLSTSHKQMITTHASQERTKPRVHAGESFCMLSCLSQIILFLSNEW
jgi:hypothetical protein